MRKSLCNQFCLSLPYSISMLFLPKKLWRGKGFFYLISPVFKVPLAPAATRDTGSAVVTSEPDETPSSMSLDVSMTNSTTTTHQSTLLNNTEKLDIMPHDQVVANKYANFCNCFDFQFWCICFCHLPKSTCNWSKISAKTLINQKAYLLDFF